MFKILLVDDHRAFRKEFTRLPYIKNSSDYEIAFEANDGKEALAIAKEKNIDIIISDIRMPVMDGMELLQALNKKGIRCVFILLSEYGTFEYAQQAMNLGAYGYLTKPVNNSDVEVMLNRVKKLLGGDTVPTVTSDNIDRLTLKLLENAPSSSDLLSSITGDIKAESRSHELLHFTEQFLSSLQSRIFEYTPWLKPFISSRLFVVHEDRLFLNGCSSYLQEKITCIRTELNKFGFNLSPSAQTESIQGICIFILSNILNPDLNSGFISEAFFFNKSYLSQFFKEKMSVTMIKFITFAKMEYAKVKLEEKDTKISELSSSLNFENPDYFSGLFKKTYGVSPTIYQKEQSQLSSLPY
ncbi:MAG: response regulator [Lachnospiraceae bacterium]|nr:response regulator [Lachnospiraceae bacterium]